MVPCSYAYGCYETWADGEYLIDVPIRSEPTRADLCEECAEKWDAEPVN